MTLLKLFVELPEEIFVSIFDFLDDARSLCRLSAVNRCFHRLISEESLWKGLFERANYQQTPYEETEGASFKSLYKRKYILDRNWRTSNDHYAFEPWRMVTDARFIEHLTADVASGGRKPILALGYSTHVQVYLLKGGETKPMTINDADVVGLALFLDADRARDEMDGYISPGVSRGWGNKHTYLVTGGGRLKVWKLPIRPDSRPHCINLPSRLRRLRPVDNTSLLVTGSRDGHVQIWDIQVGSMVYALDGFAAPVSCLEIERGVQKEQPRFAVGGSMDHSARIWDLTAYTCKILLGHGHPITTALIDNEMVVTGSMDSTIRVWNIETGQQLSVIVTHKTSILYLSLRKDHVRSLVSACFNGLVAVHELEDEDSCPLERPRSSKGFNLQCPCLYSIESNQKYFVASNLSGTLPVFRISREQGSTDSCEGRPKAPIERIRTINTGLSAVNAAIVLSNGFIAVGHKNDGRRHLLYYDFDDKSG